MLALSRIVGIRLMQCLQNTRKKSVSSHYLKNVVGNVHIIWKTNLGLMFLWPISRNKAIVEEKLKLTPSILETADRIFETGRYEECYNFLLNCQDLDSIEVKWRISRVMYNMAKEPKYNQSYQETLILQAYSLLVNELDNHADNFAVHKWYALTLDAKSSNEGYRKKLEELENVKRHMDIAVKLNPNDASLLHILGEICYQVTEMPWHQRITAETLFAKLPKYSYEDALEYFLKAEAAQPRFYSVNLLRLGDCYLKINKPDQAKYYLKLAACYPAKSNDDHRAKKKATELLKKIK